MKRDPHILVLALSLIMFMCQEPVSPTKSDIIPEGIFLDEPLLLRSWSPIFPSDTVGHEFIFDLSNVIDLDSVNDFQLSYPTSSSCDEDVFVFNVITARWDQIGYGPPAGVGCAAVLSAHSHSFMANGFTIARYLDGQKKLRVLYYSGGLKIQPMRVNPNHRFIALSRLAFNSFSGLAWDGNSFWVSSNFWDSVYNVSTTGELLNKYATPSGYPFGMTYDGEFLWLADGSNRIFKLTKNWSIQCDFAVPTDFPGSIAWLGSHLWLSEYDSPSRPSTFRIHPDSSCLVDSAQVSLVFATPGGGARGLTSDGENLFVVSDSLYKITSVGSILGSQALPVQYSTGIAWESGAIWLLNHWPLSMWGDDPVITKFKLR